MIVIIDLTYLYTVYFTYIIYVIYNFDFSINSVVIIQNNVFVCGKYMPK